MSSRVTKILQHLCRLCAKPDRLCVDIFGTDGVQQFIDKKIRLCLPVVITEDDPMPRQICLSCLNKLDTSYELYTACLSAQKTIKNILSNRNTDCGTGNEEEDGGFVETTCSLQKYIKRPKVAHIEQPSKIQRLEETTPSPAISNKECLSSDDITAVPQARAVNAENGGGNSQENVSVVQKMGVLRVKTSSELTGQAIVTGRESNTEKTVAVQEITCRVPTATSWIPSVNVTASSLEPVLHVSVTSAPPTSSLPTPAVSSISLPPSVENIPAITSLPVASVLTHPTPVELSVSVMSSVEKRPVMPSVPSGSVVDARGMQSEHFVYPVTCRPLAVSLQTQTVTSPMLGGPSVVESSHLQKSTAGNSKTTSYIDGNDLRQMQHIRYVAEAPTISAAVPPPVEQISSARFDAVPTHSVSQLATLLSSAPAINTAGTVTGRYSYSDSIPYIYVPAAVTTSVSSCVPVCLSNPVSSAFSTPVSTTLTSSSHSLDSSSSYNVKKPEQSSIIANINQIPTKNVSNVLPVNNAAMLNVPNISLFPLHVSHSSDQHVSKSSRSSVSSGAPGVYINNASSLQRSNYLSAQNVSSPSVSEKKQALREVESVTRKKNETATNSGASLVNKSISAFTKWSPATSQIKQQTKTSSTAGEGPAFRSPPPAVPLNSSKAREHRTKLTPAKETTASSVPSKESPQSHDKAPKKFRLSSDASGSMKKSPLVSNASLSETSTVLTTLPENSDGSGGDSVAEPGSSLKKPSGDTNPVLWRSDHIKERKLASVKPFSTSSTTSASSVATVTTASMAHSDPATPGDAEECPYCHKSFPPDILIHHKVLHYSERFYSCVDCGKNFKFQLGLDSHRCEPS